MSFHTKKILLLVCACILFISCSVQKRRYRPGYHTEQKTVLQGGNVNQKKVDLNESFANTTPQQDTSAKNTVASVDTSLKVKCDTIFFMDGKKLIVQYLESTPDEVKYKDCNSDGPAYAVYKKDVYFIKRTDGLPVTPVEKKDSMPKDSLACDKIYFKDGKEISAHVVETNPEEIKYKECNDSNGIAYSVYRKDVIMLRRANGAYDVINSTLSEQEPEKEKDGGTKSKTVAFILCLFFGIWGLHRYYLGYTGIGILYTCTGGLLYLGWISDLIRIAAGDLQPKKGKYKKGKGIPL